MFFHGNYLQKVKFGLILRRGLRAKLHSLAGAGASID